MNKEELNEYMNKIYTHSSVTTFKETTINRMIHNSIIELVKILQKIGFLLKRKDSSGNFDLEGYVKGKCYKDTENENQFINLDWDGIERILELFDNPNEWFVKIIKEYFHDGDGFLCVWQKNKDF